MAQHGVHAPGPPLIANLFNTAVLVLILYFLGRKPLASFLQARSDSVREGLSEAKKLLEEANETLADYSARLERMDEEMVKLREEFIANGEAERDRLVAEAGASSDRMRRDAKTRLEQEFAQLREELRVETVEKAVAAATAALKASVEEADQRRLADEYLARVGQERAEQ
jgi:F-type H+-transporting ATPase subunit b